MSDPASRSISRTSMVASSSRAQISTLPSRSDSRATTVASSSRAAASSSSSYSKSDADISYDLPAFRPPEPFRGVIRYVCTVHPLCRQPFDSYNNWAQHETKAHRMIDGQDEATPNKAQSSLNLNKKSKLEHKANAQQHTAPDTTANLLTSSYDTWYCDGVDGCTNAYYKKADFETHFQEKHLPAWNKLPRSTACNDYLLGPEHGVRLWCGFCNMVIGVSSKEQWYYDRLQHVASHFDRQCPDEIWSGDIYSWIFIDVH